MENKDAQKAEGRAGKAQLVIAFILGLIVGILVAPTFFGHKSTIDDDKAMKEDGTEMTEEGDATAKNNTVSVIDQLAGDRVLIKEITLEESGWAVVHEDIEGVPGNALGAQRFDPGTFENGYVELLRNTENNKLYYVILYTDDGDGEFDIKKDTQILAGETPISTTFNTVTIDRKNN